MLIFREHAKTNLTVNLHCKAGVDETRDDVLSRTISVIKYVGQHVMFIQIDRFCALSAILWSQALSGTTAGRIVTSR